MTSRVQELALVDCNNFYASCEKIFRPDLTHTPLVVLSNNDGCVVSRSKEAKALGIKMGQPWFEIKAFAEENGVLAFSSNYALYADMSNHVMSILSGFSPRTEVYSIDECFVDLTGMRDVRSIGYEMHHRVAKWTGINVGVGIGSTKTLAKLANHIAKTHPRSRGVFSFNLLSEVQKIRLLAQIPVSEVWGVGRKLTKRLSEYGIESALDLREAHTPTLRADFGVVIEKTKRELQGIACIDLQEIEPDKKQIISSRSFGQMVTELGELQDALSTFAANACAKLRKQNSQAEVIQVFLQTNRFREDLPQYMPSLAVPLPQPTNDTIVVNRWASHLCERMYNAGYQYKKAGVMLSEISPVSFYQADLLEPVQARENRLMGVLDQLNSRYGRGTVKVSTQGAHKSWQMRQERKSPSYTTDWSQLPYVN
jgi:DNA polymerase V